MNWSLLEDLAFGGFLSGASIAHFPLTQFSYQFIKHDTLVDTLIRQSKIKVDAD